MEILKFYKEKSEKWYADIPEWTGRKSALEMVSGADTLLDIISDGKNEVFMYFTEEEHDGADCLIFKRKTFFNGATYKIYSFEGKEINLKVWLCNVTKFIFGKFPKKIFISKVVY
jgi:hypothetical protein